LVQQSYLWILGTNLCQQQQWFQNTLFTKGLIIDSTTAMIPEQFTNVGAARLMVLMANGGASNMTARVASLTRRQRDRLRVVAAG
jgi:hypothetical protein